MSGHIGRMRGSMYMSFKLSLCCYLETLATCTNNLERGMEPLGMQQHEFTDEALGPELPLRAESRMYMPNPWQTSKSGTELDKRAGKDVKGKKAELSSKRDVISEDLL